jgi:hypothetical protein
VRSHQADGLLRVVHFVGTRIVSVAAQPAPQDDGVDAVVIKEGNEICALGTDVEEVMTPARHKDDSSASVKPSFDGVHLDGRVVYVDDAVNSAGHRLAHVVLLGLVDLLLIEKGRPRWIQRHDHSPGQDGCGSIGRVGGWILPSANGHQKQREEEDGFLLGHVSQPCSGNT